MKQNSRKKINILILFVNLIALFLIYNTSVANQSNLIVGEVAAQNVISKTTFENYLLLNWKYNKLEIPSVQATKYFLTFPLKKGISERFWWNVKRC